MFEDPGPPDPIMAVPPEKVGVRVTAELYGGTVRLATRVAATGAATTVTVVDADLVGSSLDVAVMVTAWAVLGASQEPLEGVMVPALELQVIPPVAPPVTGAEKVVEVPAVRRGLAGLTGPTLTA